MYNKQKIKKSIIVGAVCFIFFMSIIAVSAGGDPSRVSYNDNGMSKESSTVELLNSEHTTHALTKYTGYEARYYCEIDLDGYEDIIEGIFWFRISRVSSYHPDNNDISVYADATWFSLGTSDWDAGGTMGYATRAADDWYTIDLSELCDMNAGDKIAVCLRWAGSSGDSTLVRTRDYTGTTSDPGIELDG